MKKILMVPVQLDVLNTQQERIVVQASADFSRLPHSASGVDVNPNNPYISEEIVSKPFQNNNLKLPPGIHLHWSLPDALTRGSTEGEDSNIEARFPVVPNRWLIRRSGGGTATKEWMVSSDYIWNMAEAKGQMFPPVCVPNPFPEEDENPDAVDKAGYIPYRYIGRSWPVESYVPDIELEKHYPNLTVLGYGEPTFAAFYPNCHSVFGFHDPFLANDTAPTGDPTTDLKYKLEEGLQYDLIGWYKEAEDNPINKYKAEKKEELEKLNNSLALIQKLKREDKPYSETEEKEINDKISAIEKELEPSGIWEYINETLKWNSPISDVLSSTDSIEMICYSRITFDHTSAPGEMKKNLQGDEADDVTVAVGITGTEALSAYLAQKISTQKKRMGNKQTIEEQMEALLMGSLIGNKLDTGARFKQYRHEKGFVAVDGGHFWTIQRKGDQIIHDKMANVVWDKMRALLAEVNKLQLEYDQSAIKIDSLKEQLYADWYKYMVCAYPPEQSFRTDLDVDEVKYFIEKAGLEPLEESLHIHDYLGEVLDRKKTELKDHLQQINERLIEKAEVLNNVKVNELNRPLTKEEIIHAPEFQFFQKPRPRFWKPKDPVVLAVGKALEASKRYGMDGNNASKKLSCEILESTDTLSQIIKNKGHNIFWDKIDEIHAQAGTDHPAFNSWTDQPWNPLLLEWKTQLLPVKNEGNIQQDRLDFQPTFITNNFQLAENDPDVSYQVIGEDYEPSASIYTGSSILTSHASKQMNESLKNFVESHDDPTLPLHKIAVEAIDQLNAEGFHALSQSLGGFNESLLMRKESLELKIKDPLAFSTSTFSVIGNGKSTLKELIKSQISDTQIPLAQQGLSKKDLDNILSKGEKKTLPIDFTARIAKAVGSATLRAPLPQNDFNPLRAGKLSIIDLRLVDSFGQSLNLDISENLITSQYMDTGSSNQVLLRPRFIQPTQVHFRWLSAQKDSIESNELKHHGPICGWLMTNKLDKSLMIFEASGKALGSFTAMDGDWKPAPGTNSTSILDTDLNKWLEAGPPEINSHLYKMMYYLRDRMQEYPGGKGADNPFLSHFLTSINSSLINIQPDTFAQHNSIAQLMGRPLALVRASLDMVMKGPPAIHQSWGIFNLDMERRVRETTEFTKVRFPIRIGEHDQLNDGVVGYWVEEQDGSYAKNRFYSPSSDAEDFPTNKVGAEKYIETHKDVEKGQLPVNQLQTLDDDPMKISLLFDPRGKVTLTTGLLPVKTLDIPANLYSQAMEQMEVFFVSSPHLVRYFDSSIQPNGEESDSERLHFDLPAAKGYTWSFIRKKEGAWKAEEVLEHKATESLFSGEKRILEGWLKLTPKKETTNEEQS